MQSCAMAASVLAARILGRTAFGEFGILRSTIVTFGVLAGSGIGLAATKVIAEYRTVDRARTGRIISMLMNVALVISGTATVICILGAEPLAGGLLHAPHLVNGLRILAVLLVLSTTSGVQIAILAGLEDFRSIAIVSGAEGVLSLVAVALGARFFGLYGALAGTVAAPAVMFLFKQRAVSAKCRIEGIQVTRGALREHMPFFWSHLLPAVLIGISAQPFEWFARVLLARRPDGFSAVGVFTAAYAIAQVVSFGTSQITAPAVPILANTYRLESRAAFMRLLRLVGVAMAAVTVAVALPVAVAAPWIMRIYGHGFADGGPVLATLVAGYAVSSASSFFRVVLVATGRLWSQNLHAVICGSALVASFAALSRFGAIGLAIAYLIAYTVVTFTQGISVLQAIAAAGGAGR